MKLYICPKYCHIKSDFLSRRCPHCDTWMAEAGEDTNENREKLKREVMQRQIAYKDKFERKNFV